MRKARSVFPARELSDKERKNFAILDIIRKRGPIAKAEISKLTGFNIVTVSNYIEHYIRKGLVSEEGFDASSGGRKPMMINLNQKSAYVIGVGFDAAGMIGTVTDLRGEIISQIKRKKPKEIGRVLIEGLIDIVKTLLSKFSVEKDKIKGIGFAIPGVIDKENQTIRWPGPLGTKDTVVSVSFWDELASQFGNPILIENDANCAVFGEQWLALSPEYRDIIYMYSGVSCGIMINGQVYNGAFGCAGELGILNPHALDKYDFRKEGYGLGRWSIDLGLLNDIENLQKKYRNSKIFNLVKNKAKDVTLVTILEAAHVKDELAIKLLSKAGEDLGRKVAFLVNLFNPQAVIIGGGIEKTGSVLIDSLKKTVKDWAFEEATRGLKIIPAQLSENAVPLGAASLVIKNYFENM